jgi:ankyrin repeat protein
MFSDEVIMKACIRGDVAQLRRWNQQGIPLRSAEYFVECAARGVSLEVLRYFLKEIGADINGENQDGHTPLSAAAQFDRLDALRCLGKEFGAEVNRMNGFGSTPLFAAAQHGNLLAVSCVGKELGAYVNKANNLGLTALYIAVQNGHETIVQYLVKELGADVDPTDIDGSPPLFIAAQLGNLSMVQCLVKELGADIHHVSHAGATPLMVASYNKHTDIVKWLVKAGADPRASASLGMAADLSKRAGASAEQTAYLEAKTHCSSPGCSGAGIMKCTGCKQARYCGERCQVAHWKAHKADCKQWSAELKKDGRKR